VWLEYSSFYYLILNVIKFIEVPFEIGLSQPRIQILRVFLPTTRLPNSKSRLNQLGKSQDCDIVLELPLVEDKHALLCNNSFK
jgi:hypothetical protein